MAKRLMMLDESEKFLALVDHLVPLGKLDPKLYGSVEIVGARSAYLELDKDTGTNQHVGIQFLFKPHNGAWVVYVNSYVCKNSGFWLETYVCRFFLDAIPARFLVGEPISIDQQRALGLKV